MKVAIDFDNNIIAFNYIYATLETEVENYPKEFTKEEIYTPNKINRFYVKDGVVIKRTDEELSLLGKE